MHIAYAGVLFYLAYKIPFVWSLGYFVLVYNPSMKKVFCDDCGKDVTNEAKYIWRNKLRCVDCNDKIPESEFEVNTEHPFIKR